MATASKSAPCLHGAPANGLGNYQAGNRETEVFRQRGQAPSPKPKPAAKSDDDEIAATLAGRG